MVGRVRGVVSVLTGVALLASLLSVEVTESSPAAANAVIEFECWFRELPASQGYGVGWEWESAADTDEHRVLRSIDAGAMEHRAVVDDGETEWQDTDVVAGAAQFRVERVDAAGSTVASADCVELESEPVDAASAGLPVLPDGTPGVDAAGASQAAIPPAVTNVPGEAPLDVCEAGFGMNLEVPDGTAAVAYVDIPAGATLKLDLVNRKENPDSRGNWTGFLAIAYMGPDGSWQGNASGNLYFGAPYWWSQHEYTQPMTMYTNNGPDARFFLYGQTSTQVSVNWRDEASWYVNNLSFEDAQGNLIGRPCDVAGTFACEAQGGTAYIAEPILVDGEIRHGCYDLSGGCAAEIAPVIDAVANWACENDEFLEDLMAVAQVTVVVLGTVVLIGPAVGVATALTSAASRTAVQIATGRIAAGTLASEAGAAKIWAILGTGVVAAGALVLAGGSIQTLGSRESATPVDMPDPVDWVEDFIDGGVTDDPPAYEVDQGMVVPAGGSGLEQILYDSSGYEETDINVDPNDPGPAQGRARDAIKFALGACSVIVAMQNIPLPTLQELADAAGIPGGHAVTSYDDRWVPMADGSKRHICTYIAIYVPASATLPGGFKMAEETMHHNEVLYGADARWTQYHSGDQPTIPRMGWMVLNSDDKPTPHPDRKWYRDEPYRCRTTKPNGCDEFPWFQTQQGGRPTNPADQPHLRIIDGQHNTNGGSGLQSFYSDGRCNINQAVHEPFLVIPVPNDMLVPDFTQPAPIELRSKYLCSGIRQ